MATPYSLHRLFNACLGTQENEQPPRRQPNGVSSKRYGFIKLLEEWSPLAATLPARHCAPARYRRGLFGNHLRAEPLEERTLLATHFVDIDATGAGTGDDWANAYTDLQGALLEAVAGDDIWVAAGTYTPTAGADREISFNLKTGVDLYGGFAGGETDLSQRDWVTHVTTLSGDIGAANDNSDNSYHVVRAPAVSAVTFDGFAVTGGNANGPFGSERGGGLYSQSGSLTVANVSFHTNSADFGAGYFNSQSTPTLTNVRFTNNSANDYGGGIYNSGSAILSNVEFDRNSANFGGGLYNASDGLATLTNATFSGNSGHISGGGIYDNHADGSVLTIQNSILWGNTAPTGAQITGASTVVNYSIVQGDWAGTGNLNLDPMFVNAAAGDLRLMPGSPAIDAGDNTAVPADVADLDGDGNTVEPLPLDLDGRARFVDTISVPDTGVGTPPIVDMGAYEFAVNEVLYVNDDAAGLNNGTSWTNAFTSLQAALAVADAGDEIWVAAGLYKPTEGVDPTGTDRTISFNLESGVDIYGGFAGTETELSQRDWVTNVTTISGDIGTPADNVDNSYHVVYASGVTDAILDGFTITAGNANGPLPAQEDGGGLYNTLSSLTLTNLVFSANAALDEGGGMHSENSSATLTAVEFSGNSAYYGGGMNNTASSPTLNGVNFFNNSANSGGGMDNYSGSAPMLTFVSFSGNTAADEGGGMNNAIGSSPTLHNVLFDNNSAVYGGGMNNNGNSSPILDTVQFTNNSAQYGGGMDNYNGSSPSLTNVTFSGNAATQEGGGMRNSTNSSPLLTSVVFSGNSAGYAGGGVYNQTSSPVLTAVTFISNSATYGGGMYNASGSPTLTDVTFNDNSGSFQGGGMFNASGSPTLTEVAFTDNSSSYGGGMYNTSSGSPTLTDVTFTGNSGSFTGGGMNEYGSSILTNVVFSGNFGSNSGGGMYVSGSPMLTNVVFSGNFATSGGGMYSYGSPTLMNATFAGNSAITGGGIYYGGSLSLTNAILWGNSAFAGAQIFGGVGASATVSYSIVEGGYPGIGNLDVDPRFVDAAAGNFHLRFDSPAIDAGTNSGAPPTDLAGVTRPQDGDGNGTAVTDMGVYEQIYRPLEVTGLPAFAVEGTTLVNLAATSTDPNAADFTYRWVVEEFVLGAWQPYATSNEASFNFTPDDNGEYRIRLNVTYGQESVNAWTAPLSVANEQPVLEVTGNPTVLEDIAYTLNLESVTDPGDDTVHTYRVFWGDGTSTPYSGSLPTAVTHTYATPGTYSIYVNVMDEDGTHLAAATSVTVTQATAPMDVDSDPNLATEGAADGSEVGITVHWADPVGTVTYSLTDDAGGRFAIDPNTGVVTVADGSLLMGPAVHSITVEASDGLLTSTATFDVTVGNLGPMVVSAGAGFEPLVRIFDGATGRLVREFLAYDPAFTGGVHVATGDVNGDLIPDIITGAGAGGGPHVRVFDGLTGAVLREFFAYDPYFTGGVYVAAGDIDGDHLADIVTGAGAGGGPHVRIFSGDDGSLLGEYLAYAANFTGGVQVAVGDVDGDQTGDVITAPGASVGIVSEVRVFDGATSNVLDQIVPYPGFTGGIWVAAGDVDGDQYDDVITGAGAGGGPHVKVYSGATGDTLHSFLAYDPGFTGGVRVGAGDLDGDGRADILTGPGAGGGPHVRAFDGDTLAELKGYLAFDASMTGGVFVAAPNVKIGLPLRAASLGHGGEALTQDTLDAALAAVLGRLDARLDLDGLRMKVADLPGDMLAVSYPDLVLFDRDAAGHGWFVDSTPASSDDVAANRIDLLSAAAHEVGHVLGLGHADDGLMAERLAAGARPSLTIDLLDDLFAALGR